MFKNVIFLKCVFNTLLFNKGEMMLELYFT